MSMVEIGIVSIWEAAGAINASSSLCKDQKYSDTTFADWLKTVRSAAPSRHSRYASSDADLGQTPSQPVYSYQRLLGGRSGNV